MSQDSMKPAEILGTEIEKVLLELKGENEQLHKQSNCYPPENFTNISTLFARLAKVSGELNIAYFNKFFHEISEVAYYCTEVENPRAHKKVAVMVLDFEETLKGLQGALSDKEKLKVIKKSMEMTELKLDRLKRGEFFSLVSQKKTKQA